MIAPVIRLCDNTLCMESVAARVRVLDAKGRLMIIVHPCAKHLEEMREHLAARDPSWPTVTLDIRAIEGDS